MALAADGRAKGIAGTVRTTVSRVVPAEILPPIRARLWVEEPGIKIDLVPLDTTDNFFWERPTLPCEFTGPASLILCRKSWHICRWGLCGAVLP